MVELVAVLVIWGVNTLLQGALNGLIYALAALALAAVTHSGLAAIGYAVRWLHDPFVRIMFPVCRPDRELP